MIVKRREGEHTFVLCMLFAVFAFAVGLSGFRNVDLKEVVSHVDSNQGRRKFSGGNPTAVV